MNLFDDENQFHKLPVQVYALLRCGLVVGPIERVPVGEIERGPHWRLPTVVTFAPGVESLWNFSGASKDRRFDIVQMFEVSDDFDKLRVRLAVKEGA